jgi:predicted DNA-binding antitoxin AbrB/MazE fold protein
VISGMKIRTIYKNGVFKAVDDASNVEMKPGKQMEWRA